MKLTKSTTKRRLFGASLLLMMALLAMVNIVAANTPVRGQEETPEVPTEVTPTPDTPPVVESATEAPPEAPVELPAGISLPNATQTSCAIGINDLGDNNPFTYGFSAVNTANIASYEWILDIANPGSTTFNSQNVASFTYPTAGTYTFQLTCTPAPTFGAPIVLTGSVTITDPPQPSFTLSPGVLVTNNGPVTYTATNTSTPAGMTYQWCVTTSATPPATFNAGNCPVAFATSTDLTFGGFEVYNVSHYIYLRATTATNQSAIASLSFLLNAPAPSVTFTATPQTGPTPLNVTIVETNNNTGPLFAGLAGLQYTLTAPGPVVTTYGSAAALEAAMQGLATGLYTVRLDYAGPGGSGFVQRSILVYASDVAVSASYVYTLGDNILDGGGNVIGRQVCFTNTSGGPVAQNYWDFDGNGTPTLAGSPLVPTGSSDTPSVGMPNDEFVCYDYPAAVFGIPINVRLIVAASNPEINSGTNQIIIINAKPQAEYIWAPTVGTWGEYITFTNQSVGADSYLWQFDYGNDGSIDTTRTTTNVNNVPLPVGVHRVRLIATNNGTGQSDFVEYLITVVRREITCGDITGTLEITPLNANPQNYNISIGNLTGPNYNTPARTVTYQWQINGANVGSNSATLSGINWNTYGRGTHEISLTATTSDGSVCTRAVTVVYEWSLLQCNLMGVSGAGIGSRPFTFFSTNSPITYTQNFDSSTLNGRTIDNIEWFVESPVPGSFVSVGFGNSYVRPFVNPPASYQERIRYVVTVDNGDGTFSNCVEDELVTISPLPDPTCSFSFSPSIPGLTLFPDGETYDITVNGGGLLGRTVTEIRLYRTHAEYNGGVEELVGTYPFPGTSSAPYSWTNTVDRATHPDWSFRAVIVVDNGTTPATTSQSECTVGVTVRDYDPATCSITGNNTTAPNNNANRIPQMPGTTAAQHNNTFTEGFNLDQFSGISNVVYNWSFTANQPDNFSISGDGRQIVNARWSEGQAGNPIPTGNPSTMRLEVTWQYADGTSDSIDCNRTVNIFIPALVCGAPTGDQTPLPGDSNLYTRAVTGGSGTNSPYYGRDYYTTWYLEIEDPISSGIYVPVSTNLAVDTDGVPGSPYVLANNSVTTMQNFIFSQFLPDRVYRVSYRVDIDSVLANSCVSSWLPLVAEADGVGFTCDAFYGTPTNSFNVTTAGGDQAVRIDMDNGNRYMLRYDYYLVGANNVDTPAVPIHSYQSTDDGDIVVLIPRSVFAPGNNVGNYNLRVEVTYVNQGLAAVAPTLPVLSNGCPLLSPQRYIVGPVDAEFAVSAPPSGVGYLVGTCLTANNQSVTNGTAPAGNPPQFGTLPDMNYVWELLSVLGSNPANNNLGGDVTFTSIDPFNAPSELCFYESGEYDIRLTASNTDGGDVAFRQEDSRTRRVRFCEAQGLSLSRSGTLFAGATQTFTASGFGELTGNYSFSLYLGGVLQPGYPVTQASNVLTRTLAAGNYEMVVTRNGCLGVATASTSFTILGPGGIAASYNFVNNINSGLAPLQVCFNDTSVSNGSAIVEWQWDFLNDGNWVTYTSATYPSPLCYTYNTPGVYYPRLRVQNEAGLFDFAQNPVRAYTVLEGQITFNAIPQGGGSWCFVPDISNATGSVVVNYWEFDMNQQPTPTQTPAIGPNGTGQICHNYASTGTYYVNMCFTETTSGDTGCVVRPIIVDLNQAPVTLTGNGSCDTNRTATFTVNNTSANNMTSPAQVIFYRNGVPFSYQTVQLNASGSTNFVFTNESGVIRMVIGDYGVDTGTSVVCSYPPILNIVGQCIGTPSTAQFVLFNANDPNGDNPMFTTQAYSVVNVGTGATVASGNLPILGDGPSNAVIATMTGLDPYAAYRISTSGGLLTQIVEVSACNARPTISAARVCEDPLRIILSTNQPMVLPQSYEVVNVATSTVVASGSITLASVATTETLLLTGLDPYATYQVRTVNTPDNGFVVPLDVTLTTCQRPNISISHDCTMPVRFLVTNSGGNMLSPSNVVLTGPTGTNIPVSTVQLGGSGGNTMIEVSPATGIDPYAVYTLTIGSDFNTNGVLVSETRDCANPLLVVSNNNCGSYPLTFTLLNNGGAMQVAQSYTVRNSANAVVASGTFTLGASGTQIISLTGLNPYDTYTISTNNDGFAGTFSGDMDNGCVAPVLEASSTCDYPASFTIRNTGGGDMMTSQAFTVVDKNGNTVITSPNSFQLAVGEAVTVVLPATSDPYGLHTLSSTGFAPVTHTQNCLLPRLTVTASCLIPVQFLVRNTGGDMLVPHEFVVFNSLGMFFTPADNTFFLLSGETFVVTIPPTDLSSPITFTTTAYGINAGTQINCSSGGSVTVNPVLDLGITPTLPAITVESLLLNRLSLDVLGLPSWSGVPVCGHGCPIFRLYHTDESGDWDIWRLDGADVENRVSFHTNLTERDSQDPQLINAPDVSDIAPSLSPNNEWFAFASDRDGNWEIYVAPTSGNLNYAQRVTYNEIAVDVHPVWGPLNYIVYESTRTGNWDLFMVDVVTGQEYQLTDSPSNEVNAAWSPDGSKILYQSDVSSENGIERWQIYELDLLTMTVRRMTNEVNGAWDATYSPDGNRMVYRTVADNGNSVIKVMNVNLTNVVSVTGVDENATIPVFSPSGRYLAYQSNADGDLDIYVHEFATGLTRKLTDNDIDDYAPTWLCGDDKLVFTSEIYGKPNIFEVTVLPISAPPLLVEEDAFQLTFEDFMDVYPVMNAPFERASREEFVVMRDTQYPEGLIHKGFRLTVEDTSIDGIVRDDWAELNVCPAGNFAIGGGR